MYHDNFSVMIKFGTYVFVITDESVNRYEPLIISSLRN